MEYRHAFLEVVGIKLSKGTVVAVGPGRRLRRRVRYAGLGGDTHFEDGPETGKVRPVHIKIGQCVEYALSERRKGGTTFRHKGETLIMIPEQSIIAIDNDADRSDAILEQRPAGYDKSGNYVAD